MPVCHQWASLTHRARRLEPPSVAMARPLATESEVQSAGNCASVPHGLPDAGAFHAPRYCITARCEKTEEIMGYDQLLDNSYNGPRSLTCSRATVTGQSKSGADIIIFGDSIAVFPSISLLLFLRHHSPLTTVHLIEHRRGTEIEG